MTRFNWMTTAASLSLLALSALPAAANGISIDVPSQPATNMLIITGIVGGNHSDPGMRACYGSTLCKESGNFYTEQGVLNYKNGDPLVQRKPKQHSGVTTPNNPYNPYNRH